MQRARDVDDLTGEAPVMLTLTPSEIAALAEELTTYHAHFAPLFQRREQQGWSAVYLRGLLLADVPRKNVEAMALRLLGAGPLAARRVRALQQFIGAGAWDDTAILRAHQHLVEETLGEDDGVFIIDGSDVPKQGTHSVGVARQWCGATGKTDNCQAGVYLGYASRRGYTLLDRRLYLHASWFAEDHRERWQACAIPDDVRFHTKLELAAQMVEDIRQRPRVRARWLVCDEGYGQDPALLDRVAATGLWYLAEVPGLPLVWPLHDPATGGGAPPPAALDSSPPPRSPGAILHQGAPASRHAPTGPGGHSPRPDSRSRLASVPHLGRQQRPARRRLCRRACPDQPTRTARSSGVGPLPTSRWAAGHQSGGQDLPDQRSG